MLSWVSNTIGGWLGGISNAIRSFVNFVVGGLASLLDSLFGDVTGAWAKLARAIELFGTGAEHYLAEVYNQLRTIIGYDIPHFAQTAWWWVTHPQALAHYLFWYLIRELENQAWAAARHLGEFLVSLLWHHADEVVITLEDIITAIL